MEFLALESGYCRSTRVMENDMDKNLDYEANIVVRQERSNDIEDRTSISTTWRSWGHGKPPQPSKYAHTTHSYHHHFQGAEF